METWRDLVVRSPDVLHGEPRVRGTRIPVTILLDSLASGTTPAELHAAYPTLPTGAVPAALSFAAALVRGEAEPLPDEVL